MLFRAQVLCSWLSWRAVNNSCEVDIETIWISGKLDSWHGKPDHENSLKWIWSVQAVCECEKLWKSQV